MVDSGLQARQSKFPGISSRAYEHPTDRTALTALRHVTGFDSVVRRVLGSMSDRRLRLLFLARSVRVSRRQLPHIYELLHEVCDILDVEKVPELFVDQDPEMNAVTLGLAEPFLVLNSTMLEVMNEDELRCVLGHEVAHILSGHAFYKTVLLLFGQMSRWFLRGPTMVAALPVLLALREWDRKSELSADRASLLVSQELRVAQSTMSKLAGGIRGVDLNLDELERQAEEYAESANISDRFFKVLNLMWKSHPFPVLRLVELRKWAESPEYERVLSGHYPLRADDPERPNIMEDLRDTGRSYAPGFDDVADVVSDFVSSAVNTGKDVLDKIFRR